MAGGSVATAAEGEQLPAAPAIAQRSLFALTTHWGGSTPFGYSGLALELTPVQRFSLELGVGQLGRVDGRGGLGMAVVPRVRVLSGPRWAVDLGAGFSRGSHSWSQSPSQTWADVEWVDAYRVDLQSGADFQLWSKLRLRTYAGIGRMLSSPYASDSPGGRTVPYLGMSLGYSLAKRPDDLPPNTFGRWYGGQLLAFDGAAAFLLALLVVGEPSHESLGGRVIGVGPGSAARDGTIATSIVLFSLAAPIIHAEHRRPIAAVASSAARLTILGLLLSQKASISESSPRPAFMVTVAASAVIAIVDAVLARESTGARVRQ